MTYTLLIALKIEAGDLPPRVAAEDPDGLGGLRDLARDVASTIRHRAPTEAPGVSVGDVSAALIADGGDAAVGVEALSAIRGMR